MSGGTRLTGQAGRDRAASLLEVRTLAAMSGACGQAGFQALCFCSLAPVSVICSPRFGAGRVSPPLHIMSSSLLAESFLWYRRLPPPDRRCHRAPAQNDDEAEVKHLSRLLKHPPPFAGKEVGPEGPLGDCESLLSWLLKAQGTHTGVYTPTGRRRHVARRLALPMRQSLLGEAALQGLRPVESLSRLVIRRCSLFARFFFFFF